MLAALALIGFTAGCAGEPSATAPSASNPASELPPNDVDELKAIFDPQLEPLGLRLTRGTLRERSSKGGYEISNEGTHLALYVEPTGPYSTRQYLDGVITVTRLFAPAIFDRWSGLESFDICQEPHAKVDPSAEPQPATAIDMTEEEAREIDWETVSLIDLLARSLRQPPEIGLAVSPELRESPRYERAIRKALDRPGVGGLD